MKTIRVVAAVIRRGDKILATQRGYGEYRGWWEFPGGKIEPDEPPQVALQREIREELAADIMVGDLITTVEYDYPNFHLSMDCFWCEMTSDYVLREHDGAQWLGASDINSVNWLPADIIVVEKIKESLKIQGK